MTKPLLSPVQREVLGMLAQHLTGQVLAGGRRPIVQGQKLFLPPLTVQALVRLGLVELYHSRLDPDSVLLSAKLTPAGWNEAPEELTHDA